MTGTWTLGNATASRDTGFQGAESENRMGVMMGFRLGFGEPSWGPSEHRSAVRTSPWDLIAHRSEEFVVKNLDRAVRCREWDPTFFRPFDAASARALEPWSLGVSREGLGRVSE